ncbi:MAG: protein-glutamate O-methyltransferase CheR [Chloroflexota bacterium]|nr:protein-glutamate O-methyltransferase CheR [Chloroflexota bacterium]
MRWSERRYFESIRQWIYDHTGLHYPERKRLLLYHRLKKLCRRLGIPGLKELNQHLQNRDFPDLAREVACAVSTNHTYFFREEKVMQFFQEKVLPDLPAEGRWRLWSAASSSGEEAYTLAIIIAESLGLGQAQEKVAILGTDIDRHMIEQAERGVYHKQRLDNMPKYLRQRYFHLTRPGRWRVDSGLQHMCTFRRLNLMCAPWPFKNAFHVILCRNVLYYFDQEHQRGLAERLYDVTVPGGWLITSVTEPVQGLETRWQTVVSGVYRKA